MKRLYDSLSGCKKEEVKSEFCKFFKMKIFALRGIDQYTEHVLFSVSGAEGYIPKTIQRPFAAMSHLNPRS